MSLSEPECHWQPGRPGQSLSLRLRVSDRGLSESGLGRGSASARHTVLPGPSLTRNPQPDTALTVTGSLSKFRRCHRRLGVQVPGPARVTVGGDRGPAEP
eukprot:771318-Rhodomonas_salina.3